MISQNEGWVLKQSLTFDDAFLKFENEDFQICVMDEVVEGENYSNFVEDILEKSPKQALVLLLEKNHVQEQERALEMGIHHCLCVDELIPKYFRNAIELLTKLQNSIVKGHEQNIELAKVYVEKRERENRLQNQQQSLLEIAKSKHSSSDLLSSMEKIVEIASSTVGVERVGVWIFNKERSKLIAKLIYISESHTFESGIELKKSDYPNYFEALGKERTIAAHNALTDPRMSEFAEDYLKKLHIGATLDAPVFLNGKVAGVLCFEHIGSERLWLLEEQSYADAVADIISLTMEEFELAKAESKIRESEEIYRKQLEHSNQELQDFASIISHDLQEPLYKINAFGELLEMRIMEELDEKSRFYVSRMRNASQRMSKLIQDLLMYSRVASKAKPFSKVNLNEICSEVLADLEFRVETEKAEIQVENLMAIEADPVQIRQVIQNLVGNSLKFHLPEKAPVIKIFGEKSDDHFCLHVQDNGIGFDEKYLERIFGVFQRLGTSKDYKGTGIGLAICKKIAERHNGKIEAKSKLGEGSTFSLTLPIQQSKN